MKKIAIIGSGALGTALANILFDASQENEILIYGIDESELNDLNQGMNTKYFDDLKFHKFKTTTNIKEALHKVDYIVLALPSIAIEKVITDIVEFVDHKTLIINGCKGFYPNTEMPLHAGIVKKVSSNKNIRGVTSISGPSFAIEMIKKALTSIAVVGNDIDQLKEVQQLFKTNYFRLYRQIDVVGAEIGGIYKNILALGAGMLSELGFKINTLASYLTRGMKELSVFNKFMGGKQKTIYGLTGLGDLILTATDKNSRNFTFGVNFVKGNNIGTKNITLEGLTALKIVEKIREKNNLYLPIQKALYNIIYNNSTFEVEIENLWAKELKDED
ncbi:MAG: NAD(P)H-dependent glycerol-3-phosphate dehydrogenase [Mycoplasma sp.]|nr:NAD(P)H-dependent glycerol-3-phosphate dehydrogenase [Mycoplasma sp.]